MLSKVMFKLYVVRLASWTLAHVQFAPSGDTPPSPDPFNPSSFNGYSLINEVSTGGTLSSLFSILSLFTEDVKLSWATDDSEKGTSKRLSRANSDVSQLDGKIMGLSMAEGGSSPRSEPPSSRDSSLEVPEAQRPSRQASPIESRSRSNSVSTADGTARKPSTSPGTPSREPKGASGSQSQPSTTPHSPAIPPHGIHPAVMHEYGHERRYSGAETPDSRQSHPPFSAVAVEGTVARATVDSTLAVIPTEAFKKLTRKFPKATGSIVQVVLERFSRVTFMTAHKFLGLTKEILRSEATLNSLVSYPLPRSFYTGGGMQALRNRFQPESKVTRKFSTTSTSDYFSEAPSPTVRAPSLPSTTPHQSNTPAKKFARLPSEELTRIVTEADEDIRGQVFTSPAPMSSKADGSRSPNRRVASGLTITPNTAYHSAGASPDKSEAFSPPPASSRRPENLARKVSAMRKEVTAGDLATTHGHDAEVGDTYYRPLKTPGLPRMDTYRGHTPVASSYFDGSRLDTDIDDESDLREALVGCIAKSIGLLQPADVHADSSQGQTSMAPSMAMSAQGSPMFHPAHRNTSNGRPPFSNVLDMMNASAPENTNVSGLLRESLLSARVEGEDASSVAASVQTSSFHGAGNDVNSKILRDLGEHIEVLHFKKGSTLVKQGERSSGLYYVIDGFLDVSVFSSCEADRFQISIKAAGDPWEAEAPAATPSNRPFGAAMGHRGPTSPTNWGQPKKEEEQLFTIKVSYGARTEVDLSLVAWQDTSPHYVAPSPTLTSREFISLCYANPCSAKTDCFVGFLPQSALERIMERRPIVLLTLAKRLLSLLSPLVLHIDAGLDWIQLDAGQILVSLDYVRS